MGCRYFCLHVLVDPGMDMDFQPPQKKQIPTFQGSSLRRRKDGVLTLRRHGVGRLETSPEAVWSNDTWHFGNVCVFCVAKKWWEVKQGFKTRAIFERINAKPSSSVLMPMRRVLLKMVGFVGNPVMMCVALKLNLRVTRFPKLYIEKPGFKPGTEGERIRNFRWKKRGLIA